MTTTPPVQFEPIKPSSASDLVFEAMRSAIFSGALQPGAALRELHLARELKVSQATVREGLLQLECAHLAVRVPNKGTYVAALSPSEIHERCIVRTHLEQHAAIEAAARLSPEEFDILQQRAEEISRLASENAYYEVEKEDLEFHRFIWQKSGNTLLSRILEQVTMPLFAYILQQLSGRMSPLSRPSEAGKTRPSPRRFVNTSSCHTGDTSAPTRRAVKSFRGVPRPQSTVPGSRLTKALWEGYFNAPVTTTKDPSIRSIPGCLDTLDVCHPPCGNSPIHWHGHRSCDRLERGHHPRRDSAAPA